MNTDRYARVTIVLDRSTDEALSYLSKRLRHSKSGLIREVLAQPVQVMKGVLDQFPEGTPVDPAKMAAVGLEAITDMVEGGLQGLEDAAHG